MRDDKVIDELGGGSAVADALGKLGHNVTPDQVYMWKSRNRIPPEWRVPVAEVAASRIKRFDQSKFIREFTPRKPRNSATPKGAAA